MHIYIPLTKLFDVKERKRKKKRKERDEVVHEKCD